MITRQRVEFLIALFVAALLALPASATAADQLPDPDGKPADMTKPVQAHILLRLSNMLGAGKQYDGEVASAKDEPRISAGTNEPHALRRQGMCRDLILAGTDKPIAPHWGAPKRFIGNFPRAGGSRL